jgi:hypothetical protein
MGKLAGYNTFMQTGWSQPTLFKYLPSGGQLEPPQGAGKSIRIVGVIASGTQEFREDTTGSATNGTVIFQLDSGMVDQSAVFNFPAPVDFGANTGVYVTGSSVVMVWYYIYDSNIQ